MQLSEARQGDRVTVVQVGGNPAVRRRLLEMGITKNTAMLVEKYAPLKDPMEIVVKGYHISLRVDEAAGILVDKKPDVTGGSDT